MKRFSRRRLSLLQRTFILFLIAAILLIAAPTRWTDPVRHIVLLPLSLAQRACLWVVRHVEHGAERITGSWSATDRTAELEQTIARLTAELHAERNRRHTAERQMGHMGALEPSVARKSIIASLAAFNVSPVRRVPVFNRGTSSGVRRNSPVLWNGAVVGRVTSAAHGTSQVALIGDPDCAIAVRCERTRVQGILRGLGGSRAQVKYVGKKEDVEEGDVFVTSGLDGIFPPGLVVARCTEASEVSTDIHRWIEVAPLCDIERIESVTILLPTARPITGGMR
jgi:rod shape-determining protein MreC